MTVTAQELMTAAGIIPVLTVEARADAAPLARALHAGGLRVIEMTMRTPDALAILSMMKEEQPELLVGMGTIRTPADIKSAVGHGADFLVSPGLTPGLADALLDCAVPSLPGVSTASEAMRASELGFNGLKFFPAEAAGGIDFLKSLSGPLPDIRFCPTGGISKDRAKDYLALPNVGCVGGSWIVPPVLLKNRDWAQIESNARMAAQYIGRSL